MRATSYGEQHRLTLVDKFGVYLSNKKITDFVRRRRPARIIDLGCGFNARLLCSLKKYSSDLTAVDVSVSDKLGKIKVIRQAIDSDLDFLEDRSADLLIMNSVLEHLEYPQKIIIEAYRVLDKKGSLIINVPNWLGKYFLEFTAFKLGISPAEEMNDHKMYYGKRDIWPILVKAGFKPQNIRMKYHKIFLNTICYARK
jgi:ubiquinone/menaquinone biosynthesis C-methylase UbiE